MSSSTTAATPAPERLAELLDPDARSRASQAGSWGPGYLDLLDAELESTGVTQDLMLTRVVPAIYERWWRPALARAFKGLRGPAMADELAIARELLAPRGGERLLDVACGPGNFSRELARTVGRDGLVVGIDASTTMLRRGVHELDRSRLENLALIRGDATALPFRDASFDGACCFAALHLFPAPFAALDEMRRALAPGGRIAIMTSIRRPLAPTAATPVAERLSGMRIFGPREITDALRERGFRDVRQRVAGFVQFVGGRLEG